MKEEVLNERRIISKSYNRRQSFENIFKEQKIGNTRLKRFVMDVIKRYVMDVSQKALNLHNQRKII